MDDKEKQVFEERISKLESRVLKLETGGKKTKERVFAVDIDDPKWGDPEVFTDPSGWLKDHPGDFHKGQKFSACPPDYLDNLANFLTYLADKDDNEKRKDAKGRSMGWRKRMDAAKARAWAARKRQGTVEQARQEDLDDLPF